MAFFLKKGNFSIVEPDYNEPYEDTYARGWFIVSQMDTDLENQVEIGMYSKLWRNVNNLSCGYDQNIMSTIKKYDMNVWSISTDFVHN